MGGVMNGISAYGSHRVFGGTFLVFSDYMRGSVRLSALSGLNSIWIFTHDSIGLGEDGPTHQPIEHLASLRAIPNLNVYRPCDIIETVECWSAALETISTPSIISLSRQVLPCLRDNYTSENLSFKGGYILAGDKSKRDLTLIATGSEVSIIMEAHHHLMDEGIFSTDLGVRCEGECQGIVEIDVKKTSSNVMCKFIDQDGDIFFGHFKATSDADINTQGTQSFSFEEGTGKWKELIGEEFDDGNISFGALERANKGTLLIDEVSEIPFETQANVLRVLIDQKFKRINTSVMTILPEWS